MLTQVVNHKSLANEDALDDPLSWPLFRKQFYSTYQMLTCVGSLSCWTTHPFPVSSVTARGPVHWPRCGEVVLYPWQKNSSKAYFHPCAWLWGLCSLGHTWHFLSSKQSRLSRWQRAWFWFHLTVALSPKPPLNHLHKLKMGTAKYQWCIVHIYSPVPGVLWQLFGLW